MHSVTNVHATNISIVYRLKSKVFGGPDFPNSALTVHKMSPFSIFKELYKHYSQLEFTHLSDRGIAARGLEDRLCRAFQCRGRYGILADESGSYLGHSLLWRRELDYPMSKIEFQPNRQPPSWSWMAYNGAINYFNIRSGETKWNTALLKKASNSLFTDPAEDYGPCLLPVVAWELDVTKAEIKEVFLDCALDSGTYPEMHHKFVVIGSSIENTASKVSHYLLVISQNIETKRWERVGVARAEGKDPCWKGASESLDIA
jgi:hypothetical protein